MKGVYRHAKSVTRCGICKANGGYMLTYDLPRSSNEVEKSIIARGTSSYGVRIYHAILTRLIRLK